MRIVLGEAVTIVMILVSFGGMSFVKWGINAKEVEKLPRFFPFGLALLSWEIQIVGIWEKLAIGVRSISITNRAFHNVTFGSCACLIPGDFADILGEEIIITFFPHLVVVISTLPMHVKLGSVMELMFIESEDRAAWFIVAITWGDPVWESWARGFNQRLVKFF